MRYKMKTKLFCRILVFNFGHVMLITSYILLCCAYKTLIIPSVAHETLDSRIKRQGTFCMHNIKISKTEDYNLLDYQKELPEFIKS